MSKMGGDSARFNKAKKRRNVHRAKMRVVRAEMDARKSLPVATPEASKT
jgi:hypothetical protein